MPDYTLTVKIDSPWVAQFNGNNTKLCFSSAVDSGTVKYNVVAWTQQVGDIVTITWSDEYQMAASKDKFSNGAKFNISTTPQAIDFGEKFILPKSFTDPDINKSPDAPEAGFIFENKTVASCVLYKSINGSWAPIYFSAAGPLPPGKEKLTPKPMARIWFAADTETKTMVSDYNSEFCDIDFTGKTDAAVQFTADGTWMKLKKGQ